MSEAFELGEECEAEKQKSCYLKGGYFCDLELVRL